MSVLKLELVSPLLLNSRSLSLAVPGTYRVDGSCVKIRKFLPNVQVGVGDGDVDVDRVFRNRLPKQNRFFLSSIGCSFLFFLVWEGSPSFGPLFGIVQQ